MTSISPPLHAQTPLRLVVPASFVALLCWEPMREATLIAMSSAFWQVASFVAATLWVLYALRGRLEGTGWLPRMLAVGPGGQVLFGALMGTLPGCGGAIAVMTQFIRGKLGFGALVAVLTATMGDAAFLLLATRPGDGLIVLVLCFLAGLVTGAVTEWLHGSGFMRPEVLNESSSIPPHVREGNSGQTEWSGALWKVLIAPAAVVGVVSSFQIDVDEFFMMPAGTFAVVGAGITMVLLMAWALRSKSSHAAVGGHSEACVSRIQCVAFDTNSVLCWVAIGFVSFEFLMVATAFDVATLPTVASGILVPAAVAVGWIPGCGPQLLTTSLYLNGGLPLSAQIGNAISNDGDALFPALALAPRAAVVATVYSTVPALVVALGYARLFE